MTKQTFPILAVAVHGHLDATVGGRERLGAAGVGDDEKVAVGGHEDSWVLRSAVGIATTGHLQKTTCSIDVCCSADSYSRFCAERVDIVFFCHQ